MKGSRLLRLGYAPRFLKNNSKKVVLGYYSIGISTVVLDNCEELVEWF